MREFGETLGVDTVLEGGVRCFDDELRITAQLINVADGFHLWSQAYDSKLRDVFALQRETEDNELRPGALIFTHYRHS